MLEIKVYPILSYNQHVNTIKSFPGGSASKESACNVGDLHLIPGLGQSPGEGKGYPLQYSGLKNSVDCIVRGVAESHTTEQLSLHFKHCNTLFMKHSILFLHPFLMLSLWSLICIDMHN